MKLWKLYLASAGKRVHKPPLILAASAEEALLGVQPPGVGFSHEAEECRDIAEYERAILEEQERGEKIQDAQIRQFYEDNLRGLRRTLERIRKG